MASSDGEPKSIVECHETVTEYQETFMEIHQFIDAEYIETSISGYTFSTSTASRTYTPPTRIPNRPNEPDSHDNEPSPSPLVPQAPFNTGIVLTRSPDATSWEEFDTLPLVHEFQIIKPPSYDRSQIPWHPYRHVVFLLGRNMLVKYIPTFLYYWLSRYNHSSPHRTFDSADLKHLQEFDRVMKLLLMIMVRWSKGKRSGTFLFEAQVVNAFNEGQQLFSNLIQSLLLAQSRAFAMTGRKETDIANWIRIGYPSEAEGKVFFHQLNDKYLGFNQVLLDCVRWINACWIWLEAPGSESLLF